MTNFHHFCQAVGFVVLLVVLGVQSLANSNVGRTQQQQAQQPTSDAVISRRSWMAGASAMATTMAMSPSLPAHAAADCFKDCMKSCKLIAPKDPDYCTANCKDYCEQEDREDGLSGSVSASSGEVGILGGTFGQGTVPKGEDKVRAAVC
jgi:hypothetical protein